MACRVRIQPTALRELEGTVEYLLGFGPNTASAFLDEWENVIECLKDGSVEHRLSRFEPLAKLGYHTVLVKGYIASTSRRRKTSSSPTSSIRAKTTRASS